MKAKVTFKAKHPKRVALAAKILRELPRNRKFAICTWGSHNDDNHTPEDRNYCGTAACGWGWVAMDKRIQKLGVKTTWVDGDMTIHYKDRENLGAAEEFFGIPNAIAHELFIPDAYRGVQHGDVTKGMVARRLEKLAKGIKAEVDLDMDESVAELIGHYLSR